MDAELVEVAKEGAARVGADFNDPEDDWLPVMFYRNQKGEVRLVMLTNPGGDVLASQIQGVLRMAGAKEAVFLASAWTVEVDGPEDIPEESLESHPDRIEVLTILHVGKDFAAAERASITYTDQGIRTLQEWGHRVEDLGIGGTIADVMRMGLE